MNINNRSSGLENQFNFNASVTSQELGSGGAPNNMRHRAGEFVQHVEAAQEIKEIKMHQKIFYERKQKRELRRQQLQQQQIIRQKSKK
jgi:hypothetical protein